MAAACESSQSSLNTTDWRLAIWPSKVVRCELIGPDWGFAHEPYKASTGSGKSKCAPQTSHCRGIWACSKDDGP